jgi:hypothetical protein
VPQWREKRILFREAEKEIPKREVEEEHLPEEPLSVLLNRLDRTYKRLRRKMKKEKKKGENVSRPGWWRELEEAQQKLEALEKEIE